MKVILNVIIILVSGLFFSCSEDENKVNSKYPIVLTLNGTGFNDFHFYKNGEKATIPEEAMREYRKSENAIDTISLFEAYQKDYFKFLSDTDIEILEDEDLFRTKYIFQDGYLFLKFEDDFFVYGKGSIDRMERRMYSIHVNNSNEDTDDNFGNKSNFDFVFEELNIDNSIFPLTFENMKDLKNLKV